MKSYVQVLEEALAQYVGAFVLNRIKADPENALALGHQTIDATLLFIDIRSFSQIASKLASESLVSELNAYLAVVSEIMIRHGAFIDSIVGDAIFAIFGASSDRHADEACKAALECLDALKEFNRGTDRIAHFDVGIGLNSGPVSLGNIGSRYKLKFTAMGDNVEIASRLEGLTARYGCSVVVSENTKERLTMVFKTRKLDRVSVKGREGDLTLYSLEP